MVSIKDFAVGFFTCILIFSGVAVVFIWPPELSLVFNKVFWFSLLMLVNSGVLVWHLYSGGGSTQGLNFLFALLLVLNSALMYTGFEYIYANTDQWEDLMRKDYPELFVALPLFISYTKNIVAFGCAALGASVAAGIINCRLRAKA